MILKRNPEQQLCYDVRKNILSEFFDTIEEYILLKYLYDKPYHYCKNKYPYDMNDVVHMVLWIHPKYEHFWPKCKVIDLIKHEIEDKYTIKNIFSNELCNKSVKQIPHYQIFLMRNE